MSETIEVRVAFADEQFTVSSTAVSLSASKYAPDNRAADLAILTIFTDAISYRLAGIPTATLGHNAAVASTITLYGEQNIRNFKMIRVTTDARVDVTYYRRGDS